MLEEGSIRKLLLCSQVYPSMDPKVMEGSLIGNKTGLSPSLSRLQGGDKDGVSIGGGIVQGRKGVQRAF